MSSAFAPFPGSGLAALVGPAPRRKVEYATGIIASSEGDIVTDREATEGCNVLQVASYGDAMRLAEDAASGLSLLRLYGVNDLPSAAFVHDGAKGPELTLVGIADPQAQGGTKVTSTVAARLDGDTLQPTPPLGFAGAAALDAGGRLFGMVRLKAPAIAGNGSVPPPQAAAVSVEAIRKFLDAHEVKPAAGRPGIEAAKAALVRVICVRR
jgi:hypothetical protein